MLRIWLGLCKNIYRGSYSYFDMMRDTKWILKERSIQMIKDIDKSEVLGENIIMSPIFGAMAPTMLSGGVKMLINIDNRTDDENLVYYGNTMGNNCAKWILEIAKDKEVNIWLSYYMKFNEYLEDNKFDCDVEIIYNDGEFIKNIKTIDEYKQIFFKYGYGKFYIEDYES